MKEWNNKSTTALKRDRLVSRFHIDLLMNGSLMRHLASVPAPSVRNDCSLLLSRFNSDWLANHWRIERCYLCCTHTLNNLIFLLHIFLSFLSLSRFPPPPFSLFTFSILFFFCLSRFPPPPQCSFTKFIRLFQISLDTIFCIKTAQVWMCVRASTSLLAPTFLAFCEAVCECISECMSIRTCDCVCPSVSDSVWQCEYLIVFFNWSFCFNNWSKLFYFVA